VWKNLYKSHLCSASSAKTNDGNKFTRAQDQNKDNADCQNQSQPEMLFLYTGKSAELGGKSQRKNLWKGVALLGDSNALNCAPVASRNFWLLLTPGQYAVNLPECASRFGIAQPSVEKYPHFPRIFLRFPCHFPFEMGYIFYA